MVEPRAGLVGVHDRIVRGEQELGLKRSNSLDGFAVAGGGVVAGRYEAVAGAIIDPVVEDRIDDDGASTARVPDPELPEGMSGQVHDLEVPARLEAKHFSASQSDIDGLVSPEIPGHVGALVGVELRESVGLVPPVVLGHHRRIALDPGAIALVGHENAAGS
jgi:hypothetical protein